jgi:imidazolonepropionase
MGLTTVKATRNASLQELVDLALPRLEKSYSLGVRTLEIKSGYGLDLHTELKTLQAIQKLASLFPQMTLIPTFMGAHDFPREIGREKYLELLINEMIPEVAKQKLAIFCDIFMDEGFYNETQTRKIAESAFKHGLKLKLHADELVNTQATELACELGAYSADHLLRISERGIHSLTLNPKTVATLLPGTALFLKTDQAPARKLIDSGAKVAIATDFNPGTCTSLSLPLMLSLSALYQGLSMPELFASVTYNAASALDIQCQKSVIAPGFDGSVVILPFASFEELYYNL